MTLFPLNKDITVDDEIGTGNDVRNHVENNELENEARPLVRVPRASGRNDSISQAVVAHVHVFANENDETPKPDVLDVAMDALESSAVSLPDDIQKEDPDGLTALASNELQPNALEEASTKSSNGIKEVSDVLPDPSASPNERIITGTNQKPDDTEGVQEEDPKGPIAPDAKESALEPIVPEEVSTQSFSSRGTQKSCDALLGFPASPRDTEMTGIDQNHYIGMNSAPRTTKEFENRGSKDGRLSKIQEKEPFVSDGGVENSVWPRDNTVTDTDQNHDLNVTSAPSIAETLVSQSNTVTTPDGLNENRKKELLDADGIAMGRQNDHKENENTEGMQTEKTVEIECNDVQVDSDLWRALKIKASDWITQQEKEELHLLEQQVWKRRKFVLYNGSETKDCV